MDNSIEAEIFMRKKLPSFCKIILLFMLLIVCLSVVILVMNFQSVLSMNAVVKEVDNQYLVMVNVDEDDLKYVINNRKLQIDEDNFYYLVARVEDDLYISEKLENYKVLYLKVNLDKRYEIDNLIVNIKIAKENKTVFSYLKDYLVNGG